MPRVLTAVVSRPAVDHVACWVVGVLILAACATLCVLAAPQLPPALVLGLGFALGIAAAVIAWAAPVPHKFTR